MAIDATGISLREALTALSRDTTEHRTEPIADGADLTAWVMERPAARALLQQAIRSWLHQL